MDRITELRLTGQFPEVTESDGEIEQAGQTWRYAINVSETGLPNLRRIDVSVSFTDSPENIVGQAIGFVGKPGSGEPIASLVPGITAGELE